MSQEQTDSSSGSKQQEPEASWAGDAAGGFARALLRAQGTLISSLGLQASGVLHLPRIPTKQLVRHLDNLSSVYDAASTVREHKHEPSQSVWASVKTEYRLRGVYGIGSRFVAPFGRQAALGTILFASYEALLDHLDDPPDASDALQLFVRAETAPVLAGLGAGLIHGMSSAAMAALPGHLGTTWTIRRFATRFAARAPREMASDAVEMSTVFGTYEVTKRALMLLSAGGAQPVEVVSVDELPSRPPPASEGILAEMPRGAGAAVTGVGPAEGGVGASQDHSDKDPEVWFAPEVVAAVVSAGAVTGCVQAVVTHLLSTGFPLKLPGAVAVLSAAPGSAAGFVAWELANWKTQAIAKKRGAEERKKAQEGAQEL